MSSRQGRGTAIGMPTIKARRVSLPVDCHAGTRVGEYVPFYFCPRSIMLFVLCRGNHPELAYRGGQGPIVHLEAKLNAAVAWANSVGRRWAFSLSNAGAYYTQFRGDPATLHEINWPAVAATDFRAADVKEGKQAEFLMHESFPWRLVQRIGVHSRVIASQVMHAMAATTDRPSVEILPD